MTSLTKPLTFEQVAELYGVAQRTVEVWVENGELNAVNVSRNRESKKPRLRVLPADLEAFVAARSLRQSAPQKRTRRKPAEAVPSYV